MTVYQKINSHGELDVYRYIQNGKLNYGIGGETQGYFMLITVDRNAISYTVQKLNDFIERYNLPLYDLLFIHADIIHKT